MAEEVGDPNPAEAFDVLGHEDRLAILEVLTDRAAEDGNANALGFAELRQRAGVEDAGNFSYHLDRLVGHFVEAVEDGYRLTLPGLQLASAIRAGTYTGKSDERIESIDSTCPYCDEGLEARYAGGMFHVECPEHDSVWGLPIPPGAVEGRSLSRVHEVASVAVTQHLQLAGDGVCPFCWGEMYVEFPTWPEWTPSEQPIAAFDCSRCWSEYHVPAGVCVTAHPAYFAFVHEHVDSFAGERIYDFEFLWSGDAAEVVSEDPPRVAVTASGDGAEVTFTLDGGANVIDVSE